MWKKSHKVIFLCQLERWTKYPNFFIFGIRIQYLTWPDIWNLTGYKVVNLQDIRYPAGYQIRYCLALTNIRCIQNIKILWGKKIMAKQRKFKPSEWLCKYKSQITLHMHIFSKKNLWMYLKKNQLQNYMIKLYPTNHAHAKNTQNRQIKMYTKWSWIILFINVIINIYVY